MKQDSKGEEEKDGVIKAQKRNTWIALKRWIKTRREEDKEELKKKKRKKETKRN